MNEIKQIHLGRSAFTIALDAHSELRSYLDAIKKQAGSEVLEEVELRLAELLSERGIDEQKVILKADVEYLRSQLGEPTDFGDDGAEAATEAGENEGRRLYRDPSNGVLGGVASGLAVYLDMPAWVVRVLFIIFTLGWGSSIIIYILLWLLLPEAQTPSDRLRMQGKPVNVDTLRTFVENSGVKANAKEIGDKAVAIAVVSRPVVARAIRLAALIACIFIGAVLLISGIAGALYTIGAGSYALTNPERLFDVGRVFPIGNTETTVLVLALVALLLTMILLAVIGASLIRRRWALPAWLTASLVALLLVVSAVGIPAGIAVAPRVVDRYNALKVSYTLSMPAFTTLNFNDDLNGAHVVYEPAADYSVTFETHGNVDKSKLKASVMGDTLTVTTKGYRDLRRCDNLCIKTDELKVIIRAPHAPTNFYPRQIEMPLSARPMQPIESL